MLRCMLIAHYASAARTVAYEAWLSNLGWAVSPSSFLTASKLLSLSGAVADERPCLPPSTSARRWPADTYEANGNLTYDFHSRPN